MGITCLGSTKDRTTPIRIHELWGGVSWFIYCLNSHCSALGRAGKSSLMQLCMSDGEEEALDALWGSLRGTGRRIISASLKLLSLFCCHSIINLNHTVLYPVEVWQLLVPIHFWTERKQRQSAKGNASMTHQTGKEQLPAEFKRCLMCCY